MWDKNKDPALCRICLAPKQDNVKSLFETYRGSHIFEYINGIAKVNIHINDNLPDKICTTCFVDLDATLNFIEKCEKGNSLLKSYCEPSFASVTVTVKAEYDPSDSDVKLEDTNAEKEYFVRDQQENCVVTDPDQPENRIIDLDKYPDDDRSADSEPLPKESVITVDLEANEQKDYIGKESSKLSKKLRVSHFECHDCGAKFATKCKLRVHWKNIHLFNSLICNQCKRAFKSYRAYNTHVKTKTNACRVASDPNVRVEGTGKSRVFNCKECIYKTHRIKDMDAHLRIHSGEKPYRCNLCPNKYTQMNALQAHEETFHKMYIIDITCHYCGKQLQGRNTAYRHLKMHKEGKTECTVCKKLIKKSNINMHMKRHSSPKSYTCEKCASTFYTSGELCNHKRWVHGKNAPHKCDLCDYKTLKKFLIKKHQSKHTDKNIPCTVCGMFFLSTQKLASHQRLHFEERNFECPQCQKAFLCKDAVRKHMINKHLSIIDQENILSKCEIVASTPDNIIVIPKPSPTV